MVQRRLTGREVWTSDGTREGTRALTSFAPVEPFGYTAVLRSVAGRVYFQAVGQNLYFSAYESLHGRELWVLPAEALDPDP